MDIDSSFENLIQLGVIKRPVGRPGAIKEHTLRVRVTENQLKKLENYSRARDLSMSEVIRHYLNRLPSNKTDN
jgi:hypothetical protein